VVVGRSGEKEKGNGGNERKADGAIQPAIYADGQFADHEGVHCAAGDVAAKAEGTWFVGGEGQGGGMPWVGFDREAVAVKVETMYHVGADQLEGHDVARVDAQFGGRIGKLSRLHPKGPRLRRGGWNWQGCERYQQSGHYEK